MNFFSKLYRCHRVNIEPILYYKNKSYTKFPPDSLLVLLVLHLLVLKMKTRAVRKIRKSLGLNTRQTKVMLYSKAGTNVYIQGPSYKLEAVNQFVYPWAEVSRNGKQYVKMLGRIALTSKAYFAMAHVRKARRNSFIGEYKERCQTAGQRHNGKSRWRRRKRTAWNGRLENGSEKHRGHSREGATYKYKLKFKKMFQFSFSQLLSSIHLPICNNTYSHIHIRNHVCVYIIDKIWNKRIYTLSQSILN